MRKTNFLGNLLDGVAVEWMVLGAVTTIRTGQSVNKQMISANPGEYPVINSGRKPLGFINKWNTDNDPIGITTRGAGVGSITGQEGNYFRGNLRIIQSRSLAINKLVPDSFSPFARNAARDTSIMYIRRYSSSECRQLKEWLKFGKGSGCLGPVLDSVDVENFCISGF